MRMKTPEQVICDVLGERQGWTTLTLSDAQHAIAALNAAGYVVVPKEPTVSACFDASRKVLKELPEGVNTSPHAAKAVYREMIAAKP